jgi:hypothetical protein
MIKASAGLAALIRRILSFDHQVVERVEALLKVEK